MTERKIIKRFFDLTIKKHPHSKEFRRQLESGELEKRLHIMGPKFDPDGRVDLCIVAYKYLTNKMSG